MGDEIVTDYIFWRRLTKTDFNAIHGKASPFGRGGGAKHISLGINSDEFPIKRFLGARTRKTVEIITQRAQAQPRSTLVFATNPSRRRGEWIIRDQHSHRHPAWSPAAGFPSNYSKTNPPYIIVFRIAGSFHARYAMERQLRAQASAIPATILTAQKGIALVTASMARRFGISKKTALDAFEERASTLPKSEFNPRDVADARKKVFAAIYRRQGQPAFRRTLFKAYRAKCAISGSKTAQVLEAAHITPYRGVKTNSVANGLLLRGDIHTLFDLGLISIDPQNRRVRVSSLLAESQYSKLNGKKLGEPKSRASRPSKEALAEHYGQFQAE